MMESLRILQFNMGGMRLALVNAEHFINRRGINVALISEPSKAPIYGFQRFESGCAAILVKHGIEVRLLMLIGETVEIQIGTLNVVSTYWGPNDEIEGALSDLEMVIRLNPRGKWIIGGDLNIGLEPVVDFSTLNWRKQRRMEIAQPDLDSYGYTLWNNNSPTCYHMGFESINDYTLSQGVEVCNWEVVPTPTMADHQFISYGILMEEDVVCKKQIQRTTDYKLYEEKILNQEELLPYYSVGETRVNATTITNWLSRTTNECTKEVVRKPLTA